MSKKPKKVLKKQTGAVILEESKPATNPVKK